MLPTLANWALLLVAFQRNKAWSHNLSGGYILQSNIPLMNPGAVIQREIAH